MVVVRLGVRGFVQAVDRSKGNPNLTHYNKQDWHFQQFKSEILFCVSVTNNDSRDNTKTKILRFLVMSCVCQVV